MEEVATVVIYFNKKNQSSTSELDTMSSPRGQGRVWKVFANETQKVYNQKRNDFDK